MFILGGAHISGVFTMKVFTVACTTGSCLPPIASQSLTLFHVFFIIRCLVVVFFHLYIHYGCLNLACVFFLFFFFQFLDKSMCGQLCFPHKHVINKFLFLKIHPKFNSFLRYLGISLNLIHMPQSF